MPDLIRDMRNALEWRDEEGRPANIVAVQPKYLTELCDRLEAAEKVCEAAIAVGRAEMADVRVLEANGVLHARLGDWKETVR